MVGFRRAIGFACSIKTAKYVELRRPFHVVADKEIEEAIAIEIKPEGGGTERAASAQPGRSRYIDEGALPGISQQAILPHAGNKNVGESIIIVVADGDAHAVHFQVEPGAACDISKSAVAVVAIEAQRGSLALVAWPVHSVDQQDVLPAVGIVIQESTAGAECFGQKLSAVGAAVMGKAKAGGVGNLCQAEPRTAIRPREGRQLKSKQQQTANKVSSLHAKPFPRPNTDRTDSWSMWAVSCRCRSSPALAIGETLVSRHPQALEIQWFHPATLPALSLPPGRFHAARASAECPHRGPLPQAAGGCRCIAAVPMPALFLNALSRCSRLPAPPGTHECEWYFQVESMYPTSGMRWQCRFDVAARADTIPGSSAGRLRQA